MYSGPKLSHQNIAILIQDIGVHHLNYNAHVPVEYFGKIVDENIAGISYARQIIVFNELNNIIVPRYYGKSHLEHAFSHTDPENHPLLAHMVFDHFSKYYPNRLLIIDKIIAPAYQNYLAVKNQNIEAIPEWLKDMGQNVIGSKLNLLKTQFGSNIERYEQASANLEKYLTECYQTMSEKIVTDYLNDNPNVNHVFGLVTKEQMEVFRRLANNNGQLMNNFLNIENHLSIKLNAGRTITFSLKKCDTNGIDEVRILASELLNALCGDLIIPDDLFVNPQNNIYPPPSFTPGQNAKKLTQSENNNSTFSELTIKSNELRRKSF